MSWSAEELARLSDTQELRIATWRADGTLRAAVPIWVVVVEGQAFVRTWQPRRTGWYGHAVASGRARIAVPGLEAEVTVALIGEGGPGLRAAIDDAYRTKYGSGGGMVTDASVSSTLRLDPGASRPSGRATTPDGPSRPDAPAAPGPAFGTQPVPGGGS